MLDPFIGLRDIAKRVANVSPAVVSNWRARYKDFPEPYAEISGVPIFLLHSITKWLKEKNIPHDLSYLYVIRSIDKSFAVIGRPRIGKSTFVLKFSLHYAILEKFLCGMGAGKTKYTLKLIVRRFCDENNCKIRYVSTDSSLNGIEAPLIEERIADFMDTIKNKNTFSKASGKDGEKKELDNETDTIEITTMASIQALGILEDDDAGIVIYDTPGIGEEIKSIHNVSTNTYVYMLRDDDEADFKKTFESLKKTIGSSKVVYVYSMRSIAKNEGAYVELKNNAKIAIQDFAHSLQSLVGKSAIIDSTIELLHPTETVIPMGVFDEDQLNLTERLFREDITSTLNGVLSKHTPYHEEKLLTDELKDNLQIHPLISEYSKDLVQRVCERINESAHATVNGDSYNRNEFFKGKKHDRVKFNDNYDTLNKMETSKAKLLRQIYDAFANEDVDSTWYPTIKPYVQQLLIRYCFRRINEAVRFNCGVSDGKHNLEDTPPVTMWILEGLIADELLSEGVSLSVPNPSLSLYKTVMMKYYTSKSWGYVEMKNAYSGKLDYCNYKIDVFNKAGFLNMNAANQTEFINNCYNKGLMYLGIYGFYDFIIKVLDLKGSALDWI